ncbi:MAG: RidA family protein [Acidimicrobiia bacterium]|nr:RidA family protein [Acidimicrobiia bacterium]
MSGASERQLISSGSPWELVVGYSRAVRVDEQVFVAGTAAQWPDGTVDPDVEAQARRCFEIIAEALAEAGGSLGDIVRTRLFMTDVAHFDAVKRVHGELLGDVRPACTGLVVAALLDERWKVEIEVDAVLSRDKQGLR